MPQAINWSGYDDQIKSLRATGLGWKAIANTLGVSTPSVRIRGTTVLNLPHGKIGRPRGKRDLPNRALASQSDAPATSDAQHTDERPSVSECLQAGHRYTWSLLTAGTCLEGQPYTIDG